MSDEDRTLLVDASVIITLARIDCFELLREMAGQVTVPQAVADEVERDPEQSLLRAAAGDWCAVQSLYDDGSRAGLTEHLETATVQLGADADEPLSGDVALLTEALYRRHTSDVPSVTITDDKPLRQTCKALSIPVSGSIGVLIRAVERGDVAPDTAKDELVAMDEVGARLSASLLRRAEAMIDDAAAED